MSVPIDDHIIVRGHAVFDTASLCAGRLYRLQIHLRRLIDSAAKARLKLPFGPDTNANIERMTQIICATCLASGQKGANVRYWLTAGPGNLGVTPSGCVPSFYVLVFAALPFDKSWSMSGIREATVPESEPCISRALVFKQRRRHRKSDVRLGVCNSTERALERECRILHPCFWCG
eukprot:6214174-Pleurochrysis_carterae.AAC.4